MQYSKFFSYITHSLKNPFGFIKAGYTNRKLIKRLADREISARYQGSVLGKLWLVINPLLMLMVYTFVFSVVFQARWSAEIPSQTEFAMLIFSGLTLFNLFADVLMRAPSLMLDNVSYIKKIVFPLESLVWIAVLVSLKQAIVSFMLLLLVHCIFIGPPPATVLLIPIFILPLLFTILGASWYLASLGVYLRDIRQLVAIVIPIIMFLSPIFYPVSALPVSAQNIIFLNPLTIILEQSKLLIFWGQVPDIYSWSIALLISYLVAWSGYVWFMKTREGFADVI